MTHRCHAEGCDEAVPPWMLMCRKHWAKVSRGTQRWVWATYVPGQEVSKRPSEAYMEAHHAAIEEVAAREGRR